VDRAVRGLDEELGGTSKPILFFIRRFLAGVISKGDVDGDWRVPGLENQEFGGGEVSDDGIEPGLEVTTVNAQSLWIRIVSQLRHITLRKMVSNLCFDREEQGRSLQMLDPEVSLLEQVSEEGHMGSEFLDFQRARMLRELDGDSQRQFVFLTLLRVLVLNALSL